MKTQKLIKILQKLNADSDDYAIEKDSILKDAISHAICSLTMAIKDVPGWLTDAYKTRDMLYEVLKGVQND